MKHGQLEELSKRADGPTRSAFGPLDLERSQDAETNTKTQYQETTPRQVQKKRCDKYKEDHSSIPHPCNSGGSSNLEALHAVNPRGTA